MIIETAKMSW